MDRREHQRIVVGLECNFYFKNRDTDSKEFCGVIEDISEAGLRLRICEKSNSDFVKKANVGDYILFQSADEYTRANRPQIDVLIGEAKITRIENKNEHVLIGCSIVDKIKGYDDFINRKYIELIR